MAEDVYFKQLELGPMQNFIYLLGDPASREAAVVDPGWEVPQILKAAEQDGYRLTKALVTHHHFDHVMGLEELLKGADLPVYVHREDAPVLNVSPSSLTPTEDGETIRVGRLSIKVLHTPGHTPGSQCFLVRGRVLTGDTMFIKACGRTDLPGGDPEQLYESLMYTLGALDEATILCPGHNYAEAPASTIGDEKRTNPFVQLPTMDEFLRVVGR